MTRAPFTELEQLREVIREARSVATVAERETVDASCSDRVGDPNAGEGGERRAA